MSKTILKYLFLFLILNLFQPLAFSQGSTQSDLSFGFKGGVNLSKINFYPTVSQSIYPGFTGGMVIKYQSEKHAALMMEVNYTQRGWSEKPDSASIYKRRINYLEVPLLTNIILGSGKTRAIVNAGPNLSFYRSDSKIMNLSSTADTATYYNRPLDKKFELGILAGLGIIQTTAIGDFQVEIRFHYGLQNLFVTDARTNYSNSQNMVYSLTLTYFFLHKDFWAHKSKQ